LTEAKGGEKVKKGILALLILTVLSMFVIRVNAIPEDLNEDGTVDINDIYEAAMAFGSYPGHGRWNEKVDINGDGIVNIKDIVLIAKQFGTS
jgi:hypothetical protein